MKNTKLIIKSFLMLLALIVASCSPETYSLGETPNKSDIQYKIEQDFTVDPGGNTVKLINQTPGVVLTWDYVTGKSNKATETVKYAFKGNYTIKILAVTAGGLVELDPYTVTVTKDNLNYVNDPLWTSLSGGVGKSKTWYLDLNAAGVSKYFGGPMYFSGNQLGWQKECMGDSGLCWIWEAEWKGNTWIADAGDFGSMTFNLIGGPFVTVDHKFTTTRGVEKGTYFLDAAKHELTLTNAAVLQNSWAAGDVSDWSNYKIISLTDDTMQLAAYHKTKKEFVIFNFISKEYSDKWVPKNVPDPNPAIDLGSGTVSDLLAVTTTKTWALSKDSPFNWTDLAGNFLNTWNTASDYPSWTSYLVSDAATVVKNKISFSSNGTVTTVKSDGSQASGTYTTSTDGTNIITFTGITPSFSIGSSWASVDTTDKNQWKIIKTQKTGTVVTDIWFGKRDSVKSEYMVFHFVLQ